MRLKILIISIFILCSNLLIGQSAKWYLQAEAGVELSHYKTPFNVKDTLANPFESDNSTSVNYRLGGIIGRQVNRFISLESGVQLLIRNDKNIDRTKSCWNVESDELCVFLAPSIQQKRYHILEIPLRIRLQQNLSKKYKMYWAGAYSNYLYFATIYDKGSQESILNQIYYAFSLNTNIGLEYQLHPKWRIGLDINARLFEQRQLDEIRFRYGQEEKNYFASVDNINFGIVCKYQIF